MNKQVFLAGLRKGLSGLPKRDVEERLTFYAEMIDDRMEDGIPEEDAVREIGCTDEVVSRIIADIPLSKLVKETIVPAKKPSVWEIVLLALGSPVWLSVLIAVAAAIFSILVSIWAVFAAAAACTLACPAAGVFFIGIGKIPTGIAAIGVGIFCVGLSIVLFVGAKAATKGISVLIKKLALRVKREEA